MKSSRRTSELAKRYARAAFGLAAEGGRQENVLAELRALDAAFGSEPEIASFFASPVIPPERKEAALKAALEGRGASTEVAHLILTLARKERLPFFSEIVQAFQNQADEANGVGRGTVRSSVGLAPAERQQVESIVEKVLKKKVILNYKVDPSLIGGLVAQVGSYTFDDSIESHLQRMAEELTRRTV